MGNALGKGQFVVDTGREPEAPRDALAASSVPGPPGLGLLVGKGSGKVLGGAVGR